MIGKIIYDKLIWLRWAGEQQPDDLLWHPADADGVHLLGPVAGAHCQVQDQRRALQTVISTGGKDFNFNSLKVQD